MFKSLNFKVILFGFIFTFFSSFGQSFFLGLFNSSIRDALSITHGQFGSIYASATLLSSFILVWVGKKIVNKGKINSANDKPSQVVLNARPRVFSKNLEIVVVAVWDISPWPDSLIKKIEKNKKTIDEILENKKQEIANKAITQDANFKISKSSIFLPTQTSIKLLNKVADA